MLHCIYDDRLTMQKRKSSECSDNYFYVSRSGCFLRLYPSSSWLCFFFFLLLQLDAIVWELWGNKLLLSHWRSQLNEKIMSQCCANENKRSSYSIACAVPFSLLSLSSFCALPFRLHCLHIIWWHGPFLFYLMLLSFWPFALFYAIWCALVWAPRYEMGGKLRMYGMHTMSIQTHECF